MANRFGRTVTPVFFLDDSCGSLGRVNALYSLAARDPAAEGLMIKQRHLQRDDHSLIHPIFEVKLRGAHVLSGTW